MFRFIKDLLVHHLLANSRHGVHSPFVYKLVDEVIYNDGSPQTVFLPDGLKNGPVPLLVNKKPLRVQGLISRLINAFKPENSIFIDGDSGAEILQQFLKYLSIADETTLIIVDSIYLNKERKASWEQIRQREEATITVDLFWIGLVFFRKGRQKEHFKIRY